MADRHIEKIDFLRGIAILSVFLFHAELFYFPKANDLTYGDDGLLIGNTKEYLFKFFPVTFGWSGVQLFLLISGYLIHNNFLQKVENFNSYTFFSKRFWRIYPPYILTMIGTIILIASLRNYVGTTNGIRDFIYHVLMVHNFSEQYIFGINASLWSIALEAQLYLLYPLFLIFRTKLGIKAAFGISVGIAILLKLLEGAITDGEYYNSYYLSTGALWYNWCGGALLAEYHNNNKVIFRGNAGKISVFFLVLLIGTRFFVIHYYLMHLFAIIVWAAFMEWYLKEKRAFSAGIFYKPMVLLGVCSYSFYLIHQPLTHEIFSLYNKIAGSLITLPFIASAIIKVLLAYFIIYFISKILYKYLELPFIQLGAKLRNKRRHSTPPTQ